MPHPKKVEYDVVVVGAGTTGAAAGYHLARCGMSVALVDRLPFHRAGAHWVNGVAAWMFDRAGIARPQPPELRGSPPAFVMHDRDGRHPLRIAPSPVDQVDMRLLVRRLQRAAEGWGVHRFPEVSVEGFSWEGDRPVVLHAVERRPGGSRIDLHARLFVDASGMNGVLRNFHPGLADDCPSPARGDVCSAAQEVRRIRDRGGAREFLRRLNAREGENLSFMGVEGGFSTLVVQVNLADGHVDILTGATAERGRRSGKGLIADFLASESWVGEKLFGGSGAIPLRRPYDRLTARGLALLGNAGCQVFPAHGSGIGTGMIAARMLADAVGRAEDPGSRRALGAYQTAFMREIGAVCGAYDVFRRLSQRLDGDGVNALLASGLMTPHMSAFALDQRMPRPRLADMGRMLVGAARHPGLALTMLPSLLAMQAVHQVYRLYPDKPTWLRLALWRYSASRFFADRAAAAPACEESPGETRVDKAA